MQRLRTDPNLSEPAREEALDLARWPVAGPGWLDAASRSVAQRAGGTATAYQRALKQAETACRLAPHRAGFQVTLGMAMYRAGRLAEARDTLARADTSERLSDASSEVPRLAFLAMTEHGLGRNDRAAATLERCREALRQSSRSADDPAVSLRREAEQLIEPGSVRQSSAVPAGK